MFEVYCVTNTVNGKKYVGKTSQGITRRWNDHVQFARKAEGSHFQNAIRKYGRHAFQIEILASFEVEEQAYDSEKQWILELKTTDVLLGYNSTYGGEGFSTGDKNPNFGNGKWGPDNPAFGKTWSEEVRTRISKSLLGRFGGEKNPFYGKQHTDETKKHISEIQIGKTRGPLSEETREKIRASNTGHPVSEETKAKISATKMGTKPSAETLARLSVIRTGTKRSEETKRKMSESAKLRWQIKKQQVCSGSEIPANS